MLKPGSTAYFYTNKIIMAKFFMPQVLPKNRSYFSVFQSDNDENITFDSGGFIVFSFEYIV